MKIYQLCARIEFGDAVSNHILEIERALSEWGFETRIFANTLDEYGCQVASPDSEYSGRVLEEEHLLIFHYSVFCPNYLQYLDMSGPKILVYHNITPPEYFSAYDKGVAEFCRLGRELLPDLRGCDLALGDSEYNRLELLEMGFDPQKTGVLPIFVDYEGLLGQRRERSIAGKYERSFNVLFVGRAVPNKRLEDVLRTFLYYNRCVNADSHLFLVGPSWVDRYDAQLKWLVDSFGLWGNVHFSGRVSQAQLASFYEDADLFLCMSDHEGFAVPLIESMAFDVPVLAYASSAIPYTLEGAGLTFDSRDYPAVGELMEIVRSDDALRRDVIDGQRKRLERFSTGVVRDSLRGFVESVLDGEK